MPDSARKTEESEVRTTSVGIVVKSDRSVSFASCPTCPGPNRTPLLHAKCEPVGESATQAGKETDGEVVMGKVNSPSSSSSKPNSDKKHAPSSPSSSKPSDKKNAPSSPSSSSNPFDKKPEKLSYPFSTFHRNRFRGTSLDESEREQTADIRRILNVPAARGASGSAHLNQAAAISTSPAPGPVPAVVQGERTVEASNDGPPDTPAVTSEADQKASATHWQNREETIFRDAPDSSGLGPCMELLVVDAMAGMGMQPRDTGGRSPFVTVRTAGFSFDFASPAGGIIIPFMNEHLIRRDPDQVG